MDLKGTGVVDTKREGPSQQKGSKWRKTMEIIEDMGVERVKKSLETRMKKWKGMAKE